MTPGARISAAIELLDIWQSGVPVEKALTQWARRSRFAGSKDRAAIRDFVYGALRRLEDCAAVGGGRDGRAIMIGYLRLQGTDPDTVFTGEGHAPTPLIKEEAKPRAPLNDPRHVVPQWMWPHFEAALGADWQEQALAMRDRAPVYLRVNPLRATPDMVRKALAEEGISTRPSDINNAIKVTENERKLKNSIGYLNGLIEIQDLSAQMAVAAVDWPQSGPVLDYCAGGGGKALAIAGCSKAELFAYDAEPRRMADIPARAKRAGARITTLKNPDQRAPYRAVLCDVPCSGSGTWRRDPEGKWRLTPERLQALPQIQFDILTQAAQLVIQGGQLIYMTCSFFREENEEVVERFLASSPTWTCHQTARFGAGHGSDGFFLAEFRQKG